MKNDFAKHVTGFFSNYLSAERGVSPNTMRSYGASFASFLDFMKEKKGTTAERLTLDHMNRKNVLEFLDWIQSGGCSVSTRNQRLAALQAFCKYMQYEDVGRLQQWQEVMSIKIKKTIKGDYELSDPRWDEALPVGNPHEHKTRKKESGPAVHVI